MNDLLTRVQQYINCEEKRLAEEALKNKQSDKGNDDKRCSHGEKWKNQCAHFNDYTPLNSSRETIIHECLNTEFNGHQSAPTNKRVCQDRQVKIYTVFSTSAMVTKPMIGINSEMQLKN